MVGDGKIALDFLSRFDFDYKAQTKTNKNYFLNLAIGIF